MVHFSIFTKAFHTSNLYQSMPNLGFGTRFRTKVWIEFRLSLGLVQLFILHKPSHCSNIKFFCNTWGLQQYSEHRNRGKGSTIRGRSSAMGLYNVLCVRKMVLTMYQIQSHSHTHNDVHVNQMVQTQLLLWPVYFDAGCSLDAIKSMHCNRDIILRLPFR